MFRSHGEMSEIWPGLWQGDVLFVVVSEDGISIKNDTELHEYLNELADSCCDNASEMANDRVFVKFPHSVDLEQVRFAWGKIVASDQATVTDVRVLTLDGTLAWAGHTRVVHH